jgi:hypothetical protein
MQSLTSLKLMAEESEKSIYNNTSYFEQETINALHRQREVFRYLTHPANKEKTLQLEKTTIFEAARLAAQAGAHHEAIDLLLLWNMKQRPDEEADVPTALRHILDFLFKEGCGAPWQQTVAELASTRCKFAGEHSERPNYEYCSQYTYKVDCISRESFVEAVEKRLKTRVDPFRPNASVLVSTQRTRTLTNWRPAQIIQRYPEGSDERKKGNMWEVKIPGLPNESLAEDKVLRTTEIGVAAVLHAAAERGDATVVQWLLDAGVNVYEADTSANTALSLASRQGHALVCKKLLDHRCGKQLLKMRNKRRQSPSDLATSGKHNDAKRVLQPSETDKQLDNEKVHEVRERRSNSGPDYPRAAALRTFRARSFVRIDRRARSGAAALQLCDQVPGGVEEGGRRVEERDVRRGGLHHADDGVPREQQALGGVAHREKGRRDDGGATNNEGREGQGVHQLLHCARDRG